jgi:cytochrome c oxidase subunit 2
LRPGASPSRRRALLTALVGLTLAGLAALPGTALASAITPQSGGSPNADSIHTLFVITLVIALVILVAVEGALIWCLRKFKAGKGRTAAQIHGNTNLEIGWTVGAALILVVLSVVTFAMLGRIDNPSAAGPNGLQNLASTQLVASNSNVPKPPGGKALRICVTGRQYIWRYTYAPCSKNALGQTYSYQEMVVPAHTTVVLDIQSTDVDHSWWIPKLGGKFDAIPGYHNYTWFQAKRAGVTYTGQCAELCGRNHANMTARVRVVTADQYQAWLQQQKTYINQANKDVQTERKALERSGDL